jgi:tetratricopeptide (TPR) repeat protein
MRDEPAAEEFQKLLRSAVVFLRRGDLESAERACRQAIEIGGEAPEALELLGDVLVERGQREAAMDAYRRAFTSNPSLASAETKYAKLVLAATEAARQAEELQTVLASAGEAARPLGRSAALACLASAAWPGLGQWYNGETAKAAILAGAFGVVMVVLLLTGDFFRILTLLTLGFSPAAGRVAPERVSLISWLLWGGAGCAWLYAVIDAWVRAHRPVRSPAASQYTEPDF